MIPRGEELEAVLQERAMLFIAFHRPLLVRVVAQLKRAIRQQMLISVLGGPDGDVSFLEEIWEKEKVACLQRLVDVGYGRAAVSCPDPFGQKHEPQVE